MKKKSENKNTSRRKFLKSGLAVGIGTVAAGGLLSSCGKDEQEESGEKVKLLSTEGELVEVDKAKVKSCEHVSSKESRQGIPGRKFVMVIDLAKCRNARKCVEGCQEMHDLPTDQEWMTVHLMKDSKHTEPYWLPKACFHCDHPPCVKVCPVDATFKRTDGIVLIDNERCIGCKFCMAACPYTTRTFNWKRTVSKEDKEESYSPETSVPHTYGTVGKCDFCPDMARIGKLPVCITACPNGAIYFGDINEDAVSNGDEVVRFSELIRDKSGYRLAHDLGTEPSTYYLPPVNRMFPVERGLKGLTEEQKEKYKSIPL